MYTFNYIDPKGALDKSLYHYLDVVSLNPSHGKCAWFHSKLTMFVSFPTEGQCFSPNNPAFLYR